MRKRSAEEKQKQLERFLMNVAEAADAALWEYWREKEAEHRRFATEMSRAGGLSLNSDSMADRRGGGDRGSYTSPTLPCGSYPFVNLREANTLLCKLFTSRKSE